MSTPTFAKTHNLIAFLEKPLESDGFEQIVDLINTNQIKYALTVSPTIYTSCIKHFLTTLKIKNVNDDVWLQALIDGKKVVINEAFIRHDIKLNNVEGTSCLSNAVIFEELARTGAKTTSLNKFSSNMASAIICLANNQKFNFSKYILTSLVKNLEVGVPFYMFSRFIQIVGTGFSGAVTPLFGTMMVQALEEVGDLPTDVQDTPILDAPSSSQPQRKHKPRRKETKVSPTEIHTDDRVPTTSNNPLPSGEDRMQLKELMDLCINFSNKVLDLEDEVIEMKSSHKEKIKELESRMEKLEEDNRSLTKELKSFNTSVESSTTKETVVDKEESSKQRRKIVDIDADAEVNLKNVYNLDMAHEETVLSMQDVDVQSERIENVVKEVAKEMVEVMEIAKIIIDELSTDGGELNAANEKPVSVAPTNITTAQPSEATKMTVNITTGPKAKEIVFHDKEESTTRTASSKSQAKDKGKAKLVEEPKILKSRKAQIALDEEVARRIETEWNADMKGNIDWNEVFEQVQSRQSDAVMKYQALKRKPMSVAQARKYMMIYLKNMVGFKMNFFKGMSYEEIRPLFKEEYKKVQTLFKEGPEMDVERIKAPRKRTRKEKLEEQKEAEELKKNLEILPDDEDDVFVNVTPLSSNPPTIVDYKIYKEGKKEHFQIIRANALELMPPRSLKKNTKCVNAAGEELSAVKHKLMLLDTAAKRS
uniref:Synaptobrevin, longin-like domain protein n=1 Tax=Tanacetum cinerariifolium TaxID=118510 RepID=A0A6L2JEL6_TANCI|nr:hypothetical protein [Tanacetum cinerariifolium]